MVLISGLSDGDIKWSKREKENMILMVI